MLNGYLDGHGAQELVANLNNGLVFQGKHEDFHGVYPPNRVDVIDPTQANPFRFMDVGHFHPTQGIAVDDRRNQVFGAAHVGGQIIVFDDSCVPAPNPEDVEPPGYGPPGGDSGMTVGWRCIKCWTEIRPAFLAAFPEAVGALDPTAVDAGVLQQHELVVDDDEHRAYSTIHSIHDAEHTGPPEDEPPVVGQRGRATGRAPLQGTLRRRGRRSGAGRPADHGGPGQGADHRPLQGFRPARLPEPRRHPRGSLRRLQDAFVHGHVLAGEPKRDRLLANGEHTGNLGMVDLEIKGCVPPRTRAGCAPGGRRATGARRGRRTANGHRLRRRRRRARLPRVHDGIAADAQG